MNSEKVLKKDYKKQSILTILFFVSLISSVLIYYLNTKIDGSLEIIFILLIIVCVIVSICLISRILSNNRLKKAIKNYDDLSSELDDSKTICIDKYEFYFTNKYFITSKNFNIFKYSDILWLYFVNRKNKKIIIGKDLVLGLKNGNIYNLWTINIKDKDVIMNIEKELKSRVNNLIVGYSEKNKKKYNELVK